MRIGDNMKKEFVNDVIEMCREIRNLHKDNLSLSKQISGMRIVNERLDNKIREYEQQLEIITAIIKDHIKTIEDSRLKRILIWNDNPDFNKLINTLGISEGNNE